MLNLLIVNIFLKKQSFKYTRVGFNIFNYFKVFFTLLTKMIVVYIQFFILYLREISPKKTFLRL